MGPYPLSTKFGDPPRRSENLEEINGSEVQGTDNHLETDEEQDGPN